MIKDSDKKLNVDVLLKTVAIFWYLFQRKGGVIKKISVILCHFFRYFFYPLCFARIYETFGIPIEWFDVKRGFQYQKNIYITAGSMIILCTIMHSIVIYILYCTNLSRNLLMKLLTWNICSTKVYRGNIIELISQIF